MQKNEVSKMQALAEAFENVSGSEGCKIKIRIPRRDAETYEKLALFPEADFRLFQMRAVGSAAELKDALLEQLDGAIARLERVKAAIDAVRTTVVVAGVSSSPSPAFKALV